MIQEIVYAKRFVGQVALVTGAAKGIGKACALRFAKEGANVALLDFDDVHNAESAEECRRQGVEALALHCDTSKKENVQAAVDAALQKWGRIDVCVAAAGIYSGTMLPTVTLEQWQRLIDINLTGVFLTNQAVAPVMMNQRSGSIINISSMAGKTSWPASAEYSASKSGVIGLTRSVAVELAPYGITANAICPGKTLTDMVKFVASQIGPRDNLNADEWLAMRGKDSPTGRIAEPWEMAGVAAFLASNDARYINGHAIEVDGGMIMS